MKTDEIKLIGSFIILAIAAVEIYYMWGITSERAVYGRMGKPTRAVAIFSVAAALVAIVGRAILIGLIYALAAGAAFGPGLLVGCVLVAVGALLLFIPLTVRLISLVVRGVGWLCAWVYRKLKEVIAQ